MPSPAPPSADLPKQPVNRRQFLGSGARQAAGVAAGVMTLGVAASARGEGRIRIGVIGVRNRGRTLAALFQASPHVELRTLCDVDQSQLASAQQQLHQPGQPLLPVETDYQRVLDDREIDAVIIATPDHWHKTMAIQAMAAGKDVYLESPVTSTLAQGADLLQAFAASRQIIQTGMQERSGPAYRSALQYLHTGQLGTVRLAKAWTVHRRKPIVPKADSPAPLELNYAQWLGPAPHRPFNLNRSHANWKWFWDYSGGELTSSGTHLLDIARWGLRIEWPERVSASGGKYTLDDAAETPDTLLVQYHCGDRTVQWEHRTFSSHSPFGRSSAVAFYGTRGVLVIDRGGWKVYDGEPAAGVSSANELDTSHVANFLHCVRTRETPAASLPAGIVSAGWAHLGNLSYRVGREICFNPLTGRCEGDAEATRLMAGL